jgi:hypothetical protein
MKLPALLLCLSLFAPPALGAGPLDALRGQARERREQLTQLKGLQLGLRSELSGLSQRIEKLKSASKGKLLPGSELDASLKRSQELSATLTTLAQQASAREGELEAANLTLLDALSQELSRLRADFDRQTDRTVRAGLIEQLKQLRAERELVRAAIPEAKLPSLEALKPSDDPEVLLEQADLLRDNQEKYEKELKVLEGRIAERKQEVELDRKVQRFLGEESMFDDQDRRLRVSRTDLTGAPSAATSIAGGGTDRAGTLGLSPAAADNAPGTLGGTASGPAEPRTATGSDARPQLGGAANLGGDEDDLRALETSRARLQKLAGELKQKALELERRAAQLH